MDDWICACNPWIRVRGDLTMAEVLVIGGAKSGVAVAKLLCYKGYEVSITDQKEIKEELELQQLGIHVYANGHPEHLKSDHWEFVVKNPGIRYQVPFVAYFVEHGVKILTEIEIAYRYTPNFHYGAVTGTNGKTTITSLLYEMLKCNQKALVAGNIGWPLSEMAMNFQEEEKDVALELSNFQLLGIDTFAPVVSVVSNLAPDHLDYMDSVEAYYASKMKIYENCKPEDWFLRNVDDALVMEYAKNIPCTIIDFSLIRKDVPLHRSEGNVYLFDTLLFKESDLKIVGDYNLCNAMIAAAMAYKMGVSVENIQKVIKDFKSVEHRLEYIGEIHGVRYYNDSKATNTHAVSAALSSFEKNIILLAGGHDKGIPFDDLKQFDQRVKQCISFGETKEQFKSVFTNVTIVDTMIDALNHANEIAQENDVVLLSPACSSYDQFNNYEERGNIFRNAVMEYIKKEKTND